MNQYNNAEKQMEVSIFLKEICEMVPEKDRFSIRKAFSWCFCTNQQHPGTSTASKLKHKTETSYDVMAAHCKIFHTDYISKQDYRTSYFRWNSAQIMLEVLNTHFWHFGSWTHSNSSEGWQTLHISWWQLFNSSYRSHQFRRWQPFSHWPSWW